MSDCPHEFYERESAVATEGYCSLCMAAEIERLRAALQSIVQRYETAEDGWPAEDMREMARRALEGRE